MSGGKAGLITQRGARAAGPAACHWPGYAYHRRPLHSQEFRMPRQLRMPACVPTVPCVLSESADQAADQALGCRVTNGARRWKGYAADDDTWEPRANLESSAEKVREFEAAPAEAEPKRPAAQAARHAAKGRRSQANHGLKVDNRCGRSEGAAASPRAAGGRPTAGSPRAVASPRGSRPSLEATTPAAAPVPPPPPGGGSSPPSSYKFWLPCLVVGFF